MIMHIVEVSGVVLLIGAAFAYCIAKGGDTTHLPTKKNDFGPKKYETPLADFYVDGKLVKPGQLEAGYFHRKFTAQERLDIIDNTRRDRYNVFNVPQHDNRNIPDEMRTWAEDGHNF